NIRELLADNMNGLLFEPGNRDALRERIHLLCENAELRARLGEAARRTVIERDLTWIGNAKRVVAVAERLLAARGAQRVAPGGTARPKRGSAVRDIILPLIAFAAVPAAPGRPAIGLLVWSWLGYMNPHRLTWGFAYSFPFVMISAVATLI